MFHSTYLIEYDILPADFKSHLESFDSLYKNYLNRLILKKANENEVEIIESYQYKVNELFKDIDTNYFAFAALITSDDLREKLMKQKL